jgi:CDP-diglyceride synthetase
MVYYLAGVTLTVAAYPKKVGVLAILFLALGDPFASTMGIKFGKFGPRFSNGKSLIGTLAGLTICALTTAIYFSRGVQDGLTLALVSLLGGLAGSAPSPSPFASLPITACIAPFCSRSFLRRGALCMATRVCDDSVFCSGDP